MNIRLATIEDLNDAFQCILDAKKLLLDSGSLQWNGPDGYPNIDTIKNDILNKNLYVAECNNVIKGIVALVAGDEDNYKVIYDGSWQSTEAPYLSLHRIAVRKDSYSSGISVSLVNYAIELMKRNNYPSLKADTHILNIPMQKLLLKTGFKKRGYIKLLRTDFDNIRDAYEYINE